MNGTKLILPTQLNAGNAEEELAIRNLACKFVDLSVGQSNKVFLAALAVCLGSTVNARFPWEEKQAAWETAIAIANHSRSIKA